MQDKFGAIPDKFALATRADGLTVTADTAAHGIPATLGLRTYLGRAYQYQCDTPAGRLIANGALSAPLELGRCGQAGAGAGSVLHSEIRGLIHGNRLIHQRHRSALHAGYASLGQGLCSSSMARTIVAAGLGVAPAYRRR